MEEIEDNSRDIDNISIDEKISMFELSPKEEIPTETNDNEYF